MADLIARRLASIIAGLALIIFILAGLLGGGGAVPDVTAIQTLGAERAAHIGLTALAIAITNAGGAPGMITIFVIIAIALALQRRWSEAIAFAAIVLAGRAIVELLKLAIQRARPSFGPYPVGVSSLSFPSAHAANSMITFLTIALLIVPPRFRALAVTTAVSLSGVIGATRPFLGVHWPTDVVGGWAFGIAWAVSLATAYDYWRASRATRAA